MISELGALRLAFRVCVVAREDADAGDESARAFLQSDFAQEVREVLESSSPDFLQQVLSSTVDKGGVCAVCGAPVEVRSSGVGSRKKYCSKACSDVVRNRGVAEWRARNPNYNRDYSRNRRKDNFGG